MPQIKTYGGQQVQARNIGGNISARASANDFGAAIGTGLQQVGNVMSKYAAEMKQKDDDAKVKAATNAFRQRLNERTYLDDDGFYNRKGIDAYDNFDSFMEEFNEIKKEIAKDLGQGRQQNMFGSLADEYITRENEQMSRHAATERTGWLNGQDEATITQAQQDGALRYIDNSMYVEQIQKAAANLQARNGWSDEEAEVYSAGQISNLHINAFDGVVEKSPAAARDYFETHKDSINPEAYDEIEATLKLKEDAVFVQTSAESIMQSGGTRSARLKMVNELTDDPEQRKMLRTQVEADFLQEKYAKQEAAISAYESAHSKLFDPTGEQMTWTQYISSNQAEWDALEPNMQDSITKRLTDPENQAETNIRTYNEARGMIVNENVPVDVAREFIMGAEDLSLTDKRALLKETYNTGSDGSKKTPDPYNADARREFQDWIEATLGKRPTDPDDYKVWSAQYNMAVGVFANSLTEDDNFDTRRKLLDRMSNEYIAEKTPWYWTNTPAKSMFDLPEEVIDDATFQIDSLGIELDFDSLDFYLNDGFKGLQERDRADIIQITNALQARDIPVTLDTVLATLRNKRNRESWNASQLRTLDQRMPE